MDKDNCFKNLKTDSNYMLWMISHWNTNEYMKVVFILLKK